MWDCTATNARVLVTRRQRQHLRAFSPSSLPVAAGAAASSTLGNTVDGSNTMLAHRRETAAGVVSGCHRPRSAACSVVSNLFVFHNNCVSGLALVNNKLISAAFDHLVCVWKVQDLLGCQAQQTLPYPVMLVAATAAEQAHDMDSLNDKNSLGTVLGEVIRDGEDQGSAGARAAAPGGGGQKPNQNAIKHGVDSNINGGSSTNSTDDSESVISPAEAARRYPELPLDYVISYLEGYAVDPRKVVERLLVIIFVVLFYVLFGALFTAHDGGISGGNLFRASGPDVGRPHSAAYVASVLETRLASYPIGSSLRQPRTFLSVNSASAFFDWTNSLVNSLWLDRVEAVLAGANSVGGLEAKEQTCNASQSSLPRDTEDEWKSDQQTESARKPVTARFTSGSSTKSDGTTSSSSESHSLDDGGGSGSNAEAANGELYPTLAGGNILLSTLRFRARRVGEHSCTWNSAILPPMSFTGVADDESGRTDSGDVSDNGGWSSTSLRNDEPFFLSSSSATSEPDSSSFADGGGGSASVEPGATLPPPCYVEWIERHCNEFKESYLCPPSSPCGSALAAVGTLRFNETYCTRLGIAPASCTFHAQTAKAAAANVSVKAADGQQRGFSFSSSRAGPAFQGSVNGHYDTAGYPVDLYFSDRPETAEETLKAMMTLGYVDDVSTRLVDTSLYVYNLYLDVFIMVHLICEIPAAGVWVPAVQTTVFEVYNADTMAARLGLFVVLLALDLVFLGLWLADLLRVIAVEVRDAAAQQNSMERRRGRELVRHRKRHRKGCEREVEAGGGRLRDAHRRSDSFCDSDGFYSAHMYGDGGNTISYTNSFYFDDNSSCDEHSGSTEGAVDRDGVGLAGRSAAERMTAVGAHLLCFSSLINGTHAILFLCCCGYFFRWIALSSKLPVEDLVTSTTADNRSSLVAQNAYYLSQLDKTRRAYSTFLRLAGVGAIFLALKALSYLSRVSYMQLFAGALQRTWRSLVAVAVLCLVILGLGMAEVAHLALGTSVMSLRKMHPDGFNAVLRSLGGWPINAQGSDLSLAAMGGGRDRRGSTTANMAAAREDHYLGSIFVFVVLLRCFLLPYFISLLFAVVLEGYTATSAALAIVPVRMILAKLVRDIRCYLDWASIKRRVSHCRQQQQRRRERARMREALDEEAAMEEEHLRSVSGKDDGGSKGTQAAGGSPLSSRKSQGETKKKLWRCFANKTSPAIDNLGETLDPVDIGGFFIERSLVKELLRQLKLLASSTIADEGSNGGNGSTAPGQSHAADAIAAAQASAGVMGSERLGRVLSGGGGGGGSEVASSFSAPPSTAPGGKSPRLPWDNTNGRETRQSRQGGGSGGGGAPMNALLRQSDILFMVPESTRITCRSEIEKIWSDLAWNYHYVRRRSVGEGGQLDGNLVPSLQSQQAGAEGGEDGTRAAASGAFMPASTVAAEREVLAEVQGTLRQRLGRTLDVVERVQRRLDLEEARVRPLLEFLKLVMGQLHLSACKVAAAARELEEEEHDQEST